MIRFCLERIIDYWTIFRHDDISVMQDITLSEDSLNVSAGLVEQGREWDNFKQRFIAQ